MNRKQVFDFIFSALGEQGFEQACNEEGEPCYQHMGRRCAIGHLMTGDSYSQDMEGEPIDTILDSFPSLRNTIETKWGEITAKDVQFLAMLQSGHDEAETPAQMREDLTTIARFWRL